MLASSRDKVDVLQAYGHHANFYITKPIDIDSFLSQMRTISEFWFTIVRLPTP